jgi:hypothetical protein
MILLALDAINIAKNDNLAFHSLECLSRGEKERRFSRFRMGRVVSRSDTEPGVHEARGSRFLQTISGEDDHIFGLNIGLRYHLRENPFERTALRTRIIVIHRRRGKPSPKRVPLGVVERVLGLYREKYFDLNLRHFHEKLQAEHQIELSYSWGKGVLTAWVATAQTVCHSRGRLVQR